ncbi:MAG: hypothetical protein Q8Q65_03530, partial [bacterium]|nr:hypothetical protein [bacterium]
YFLTLVGPAIKQYVGQYVEVAKLLTEQYQGFSFVVWLEDRLSALDKGWDQSIVNKAVGGFRDYFSQSTPSCKIMVSSETSSGIPTDFADTHLAKVSGADLISILPYHLRSLRNMRVIDVAHFAWMCYLIQKCPGIHFAGANTVRQYQVFHKIGGENLTALFIKRGSYEPIK